MRYRETQAAAHRNVRRAHCANCAGSLTVAFLCLLLFQGAAANFGAEFSISFEEPEFADVAAIDGLMIDTLNGSPIVGMVFSFTVAGEPSDVAMIRGGPGDSPFVQDPGIEGPTSGELRIDFSSKVSQVIFGMSLSRRQAQQDAIRVRTYDDDGRVIAESVFSTSAIQGSFSGTWVSIASSDGFQGLSVGFSGLANRFSLDNVFVATPAVIPQTLRISERASDSDLLSGPDDELTLTWTEHADSGERSLQAVDLVSQAATRILVGSRPRPSLLTPSTTRTSDGRLLVSWSGIPESPSPAEPPETPVIKGRFLSASPGPGERPGDEFVVAEARPSALTTAQLSPRAYWFLWSENESLSARKIDEAGQPSSPVFQLPRSATLLVREVLPIDGGSSMIAVWEEESADEGGLQISGVFAALLNDHGFDEASIVRLNDLGSARSVDIAKRAEGGVVAVWLDDQDFGSSAIRVRRLDAQLVPEGPSLRVSPARAREPRSPRVALNQAGDIAVIWTQAVLDLPAPELAGQAPRELAGRLSSSTLIDGSWTELHIPTAALSSASPVAPTIQLNDSGTLTVAWESEDEAQPTALMATTLALARPACGSPTSLCLGDDRFEVEVTWWDFEGGSGEGRAQALSSDTGVFWFFDRESAELVVKILDGRAINGSYWVYYGSLTNVGFELTVTEKATGLTKTYSNPAGEFASVGDTEAFPVAPIGSMSRLEPPSAAWHAPGLSSESVVQTTGPCSDAALCLGPEDRFEITVEWRDFDGATGAGRGQTWSESSGYLWFFDPANVEIFVKILDGRQINGSHWVYFASLSNVAFELNVTDRVTGATARYENPSGTFASFGDISALPAN